MAVEVSAAQRLTQPYRDVGLLIVSWPDGTQSVASAVLVGRNDVLTAGHAIYNPDRGGWATKYSVYFGADFSFTRVAFDDPGTPVHPTRWSVLSWPGQTYANADNGTMEQSEAQYDVALLGLDRAVGDTLGWLGIAPGFDGTQVAEAVGFPSNAEGMQTETVSVTRPSWYALYESAVDVFAPGSSGGPLLVGNQVIGVKSTSSWWADVGGSEVYGALLAGMLANDTLLDAQARPTVTAFTPGDAAATAPVAADLVLQFSEVVRRGSGTISLRKMDGTLVESFDVASSSRVEVGGPELSIDPTKDLAWFTRYTLSVSPGAVQGLSGLASADGVSYGFYTGGTVVPGTPGDDAFASTYQVEEFNGGAGLDTAVFRGAVGGYSLTIDRAARTAIVSDATPGRDGTDLLRQVEKVQFGTQVFDLFNPARTSVPAYKANRDFLFDPAYYLLSNPTLATSVTMDAASTHYLSAGAAQGLRPNAWFDASYYANRWPDLKAANLDTATLFLHYNLYGVWEGRSAGPVFDTYDGTRYLRDNPDVAAYVDGHVADFLGSRTNGAIAHYVIYGADEGREAYDAAGARLDAAVVIGVSP